MKFVIIGPALYGNKGAAAMLESTIQTLSERYPKAEFTLLSHYPEQDKRLNTFKNLSIISAKPIYLALVINPAALLYRILPFTRQYIFSRLPAIKALAESDALLEEGGITFNDGREIYLLFNIATILPALLMRKPVIKCAQALGPFNNPINKLSAKIFLPRLKLIVARGEYTYKNLESLNLKNIAHGADYAFSLKVNDEHVKAAKKFLAHPIFKSHSLIVGISPSCVVKKHFDKANQDYVGMMVKLIEYLIDTKHEVMLTPHSIHTGSKNNNLLSVLIGKSHNNDVPLCNEIYNKVSNKVHCCFIKEEVSSQTIRFLIGKCDLFITSRFHGMISSLAMGVPTLVIGWSHKYAEVLKMFDLEEFAIDSKNLIKSFSDFEKKSNKIELKIQQHLPRVKALSKKHVELIGNILKNG